MTDNAVLRLDESVAYQDGSIVSRKLVSSAGGNVSAFAFDAGEELSEHTTPHAALIQVLDGVAEIRIDGVPYTVAAGASILLPAGRPHAVRAGQRFKMLLTMLKSAV
jgi:quercetin dioxygenase-like cupin family protein